MIRMWNWWKSTSLMWPMQRKFWGSEMGPSPIFKKLVLMFTGNSRTFVMLLGMTMILSHITRTKPTSTSHTCQMGPLMISSQSSIRSYWWDFCLFCFSRIAILGSTDKYIFDTRDLLGLVLVITFSMHGDFSAKLHEIAMLPCSDVLSSVFVTFSAPFNA